MSDSSRLELGPGQKFLPTLTELQKEHRSHYRLQCILVTICTTGDSGGKCGERRGTGQECAVW